MTRGFEAINKVTIDAPQADVWDALTNPAKVKEYLHGTEMSTDWKEGSPIYWRGEWKGKPYEDKGKVLEVKPDRKSTRLNSSHRCISYAVFCLKKKK